MQNCECAVSFLEFSLASLSGRFEGVWDSQTFSFTVMIKIPSTFVIKLIKEGFFDAFKQILRQKIS